MKLERRDPSPASGYAFEMRNPGASQWMRSIHVFDDPMDAVQAAHDWLAICATNDHFVAVRVVKIG